MAWRLMTWQPIAMTIIGRIEPQPPTGIKYMLGNESWLAPEDRTPIRLHCEEWGNLGPMELDPEIQPNAAGFRVRGTDFFAPEGARGFTQQDGVYYWTAETIWELVDKQAVAKDGLAPSLGSPGIPSAKDPNGERAGEENDVSRRDPGR